MTQTLPDLVRPTLWRLHLRTAWGSTGIHQVEGAYLDDALQTTHSRGISAERVLAAEFLRLGTSEWRQVPAEALKEAIESVTRS